MPCLREDKDCHACKRPGLLGADRKKDLWVFPKDGASKFDISCPECGHPFCVEVLECFTK